MNVCFLGLGIMGFPIAGHLSQRFGKISVWNRSGEKSLEFTQKHQAVRFASASEAVRDADFIMMCLGNDVSVEQTVAEVLPFVKKDAVIIDHTTTSAELARRLCKTCKESGVHFLDAPMTGGQAGAVNGTLVMMCGGDLEIFEKSKVVLQSYTAKLEYFGEAGIGQTCKMVNQIAIAGVIQGLAEAVNFAQKAGVDASRLFKIIAEGAGGSWQMKNRSELMLSKDYKEDFGFPVEWMIKDLNICLAEAQKIGASMEMTSQIAKKYEEVAAKISPRFDTSSLILILE